MSFMSEFKEFAMRGNVVDLAVGVIIGAAFGKIVDSLVKDIVMPWSGCWSARRFSPPYVNLGSQTYETMESGREGRCTAVKYGQFINTTIDFIIIAFAIFIAVKAINKLKRTTPPPPEAPAPEPEEVKLLREIRDSLKRG